LNIISFRPLFYFFTITVRKGTYYIIFFRSRINYTMFWWCF